MANSPAIRCGFTTAPESPLPNHPRPLSYTPLCARPLIRSCTASSPPSSSMDFTAPFTPPAAFPASVSTPPPISTPACPSALKMAAVAACGPLAPFALASSYSGPAVRTKLYQKFGLFAMVSNALLTIPVFAPSCAPALAPPVAAASAYCPSISTPSCARSPTAPPSFPPRS